MGIKNKFFRESTMRRDIYTNSVFNGIKLHPLEAMPTKMNINTLLRLNMFMKLFQDFELLLSGENNINLTNPYYIYVMEVCFCLGCVYFGIFPQSITKFN